MQIVDNDNFETLWEQFDTKETDDLGLEKSNLCEKMLRMVEGKKKEEIQLELNLTLFIFGAQRILENFEDVDTAQLAEYTERFLQKCNEKSFEYYKMRFNETKSLLNKWRYSFALWSIKKESEFIENSISLLIDSSLKSMQDGEPIDTVNLLMTAYSLCNIYNIRKFEQPISEATVKIFFSFEDTEHARWMTEPAEIFAAINRTADEKLVNKMIAALHKEAERFFQKRNHHLHQSLLEASIRSGRQLIKCLASFVDDEFLAKYLQAVSSSKTPGTYPVSLAISAKLFGIPKRKAALMFFYGFAVSIVGAALRLGILQHFEGQQILNELKPTISETINRYISTPYDQMWQFAPQADIIQIHHEKMYSKMFIT